MTGTAFLNVAKLKDSGIIKVAARHNKRVIQEEIGALGNINPARSHLNETLMGAATADDVAQLAHDLMTAAGVGALRKGTKKGKNDTRAVVALEILFSLPDDHGLDDRAFFLDCCDWSKVWFEGAPILSADIHRDEAKTHCHVLMLPLVNGRMNGSDLLGNKPKLVAMQNNFHDKVATKYGLKKAPKKLYGAAKTTAVAQVLQRLKELSDPVLDSLIWPEVLATIETDPLPFLPNLEIKQPTAPPKKMRTVAEIFTSKGKGPKFEKNPIGQAKPIPPAAAKSLLLPCVGQRFHLSPNNPVAVIELRTVAGGACDVPTDAVGNSVSDAFTGQETIRVRENDLDPALYDPTTGEYFKRPPAPDRNQRQAAESWVKSALGECRVRQAISLSVED